MEITFDEGSDSCGRGTYTAYAHVSKEEWQKLLDAGCVESGSRFHKDKYYPGCGWSDTFGGPYMYGFQEGKDGVRNYDRPEWPKDGRTPHLISDGRGGAYRVGGGPVHAVIADWVPLSKTPCVETGNEYNS